MTDPRETFWNEAYERTGEDFLYEQIFVRSTVGGRTLDSVVDWEIRDAIAAARATAGELFPIDVSLNQDHYVDGVDYAGRAYFDPISSRIELSLQAACVRASAFHSGLRAAPEEVQLWATIFEETYHLARMYAGEFDHEGYFHLPVNPTPEEMERFLLQPEERMVEEVLNDDVLQEKFGHGTRRINKIVFISS